MEWIAEVLSGVGALFLSVAIGLLMEELLFGILGRFLFSTQVAVPVSSHREKP